MVNSPFEDSSKKSKAPFRGWNKAFSHPDDIEKRPGRVAERFLHKLMLIA